MSSSDEKQFDRSLSKAERRKEEVADAAWEVIAKKGLGGASMREISHHLGVTVGTLTHYFRNKDQLLEFAQIAVSRRLKDRYESVAEAPPSSRLMMMIEALLPTDETRRDNEKVWLTFLTETFTSDELKQQTGKRWLYVRSSLTEIIIEDRKLSGHDPVLSPEDEADLILCFTEGLCVHSIIDKDRFPPERQRALAREILTAINIHTRAI